MCLAALNDDDRATLVAPTERGKRDVLFSLLSGPQSDAIVLPRDATLERVAQKARVFRRVFDWPAEWAGELIVERPAIFERDGGKWRLKEFGVLSGTASAAVPAAEPSEPDEGAHAAEPSVDEAAGDTVERPAERTHEPEVAQAGGRRERAASFDLSEEQSASRAEVEARDGVGAELSPLKTAHPSSPREAGGQADRGADADGGSAQATRARHSSGTSSVGAVGRDHRPAGDSSRAEEKFVSSSGFKPVFAAVAALLVLVLAIVGIYMWSQRGTVVSPTSPTPAPNAEASLDRPAPEQGMVFVPGGTFKMGRNDGDNYEGPAHDVTVDPFYIDKFEVTCQEYQLFIDKEKRPAPQGWRNGKYPADAAGLPVTGVSWVEADAYARWAGKRLPTEKEWEFAARGTDGRLYPWGKEWKPENVNAAGSGPGRPTEVGLHPKGASPFEALDMVGNVWEWTADSIHSYEGGSIPEDSLPASRRNSQKVLRGGCYLSNAQQATTTYRRGWPEQGADYEQTGFRCAKSVAPRTGRN
jgi:formylglycine-generating enzyme required for sulfatase activity